MQGRPLSLTMLQSHGSPFWKWGTSRRKPDRNGVLEILLREIQFAVPAVKKLIEAWDKDEITLEEIKALADIKRPDEF